MLLVQEQLHNRINACLTSLGVFVWAALRCHLSPRTQVNSNTSPRQLVPNPQTITSPKRDSPFAKTLKARILTDIHTTRQQTYLLIAYHQLHTFPTPEARFPQEWGDGVCDY